MLDTLSFDTLSALLTTMKLKSSVPFAFDAGGKWAIDFAPFAVFALHVLLKGECWISIEGDGKEYHLKPGDCVLLTSSKPYVVRNDLYVLEKTPAHEIFGTQRRQVTTWNGGGDFFSLGVYFQFEGHLPQIVFGNLPAVIHIPSHVEQAATLHWTVERFRAEFHGNNVGRSLILNHLAPIMLLQVLQVYLASAKEQNWLTALSDPRLSPVINAIHADYPHPWSLRELAQVACMSRSGFAFHFKKQVGVAPMDYLTHWRMQMACELLEGGNQSVGAVANAVGYESESAFSLAFKKIIRCRPGHYQKSRGSLESA